MKENVILIGFMGAGKSTVGRMLAMRLGYSYLDTDELLVEEAGMSINEIFAKKGEEAFRKMETDLLTRLKSQVSCAVISTGGGLPLRDENVVLLKRLGIVTYLKVTKEIVVQRLKGDTSRPLLAGNDAEQKVEALLKERHPRYQAACDLEINAGLSTPEEVTNSIISSFCKIFNH